MNTDGLFRHGNMEPDLLFLRSVLDLSKCVLDSLQQISLIFTDLDDMLFQTSHLYEAVYQKM